MEHELELVPMKTTETFNLPSTPPYVPTRNALKAVLTITLFFITFLAGISTFFLKQFVVARSNSRSFSNAFSFISVFGAGVFLATCLLDLLPESLECFKKANDIVQNFGGFPFPELCIAGGFLLVLILEQIRFLTILYANERHWIGDSETGRLLNGHEESSRYQCEDVDILSSHEDDSHQQHQHHRHPPQFHNHISSSTTTAEVAERGAENAGDTSASSRTALLASPDDLNLPATQHEHSAIRVLLLVFALSLHAVFEGLSLGMITDVSILLQVFFALLIHKSIIGFSLGLRIFQSKLRRLVGVLCCLIFAGQVIIGGFIGVAVVDLMNRTSKSASSFVSGILQSIACGTFLYITCFEILPHELNKGVHRLTKMLFLLLGFALITAFVYLFPD